MSLNMRIASPIGAALVVSLLAASPGWGRGGHVMPASAQPHGYSLEDMARLVAPFTRSNNDLAHYPVTPLQVLYIRDMTISPSAGGIMATGRNEFNVAAGTSFYLPVFNVNDEPPVLGTFPSRAEEAPWYLFDPSQYGGRDFEVTVDGALTVLGPDHLVGPVPVDGIGGRIITLGAFLSPMSRGSHTVQIRGGAYGDLVDDAYGVASIAQQFTYTVNVH